VKIQMMPKSAVAGDQLLKRVAFAVVVLFSLFLAHGALHHLWANHCEPDHCTLFCALSQHSAEAEIPVSEIQAPLLVEEIRGWILGLRYVEPCSGVFSRAPPKM
jgi:hypothetical protein